MSQFQLVKVKDNMMLDKQIKAYKPACTLFLRQLCQKQPQLLLLHSSACHYSYKAIMDTCVTIWAVMPK